MNLASIIIPSGVEGSFFSLGTGFRIIRDVSTSLDMTSGQIRDY